MKKLLGLLLCLVILSSHDMVLKPYSYHVKPGSPLQIALFNGTFDKSDNIITRDRMLDVSLVAQSSRTRLDTALWTDEGTTSILELPEVTGSGTQVLGVSTGPRVYRADGAGFNKYLKHDGVLDELSWRENNGTAQDSAAERYSKHVKTIIQVGEDKTGDWSTVLGYPIELVPMSNPYELQKGDMIKLKLLRAGEPLANQLVYANCAHYHGEDAMHNHDHGEDQEHSHDDQSFRTDANGVIEATLDQEGIWYFRTIHMQRLDDPELTHESNWATLTFELGHGHSHLPGWLKYALIGALVLGVLYFVIR